MSFLCLVFRSYHTLQYTCLFCHTIHYNTPVFSVLPYTTIHLSFLSYHTLQYTCFLRHTLHYATRVLILCHTIHYNTPVFSVIPYTTIHLSFFVIQYTTIHLSSLSYNTLQYTCLFCHTVHYNTPVFSVIQYTGSTVIDMISFSKNDNSLYIPLSAMVPLLKFSL